MVPRLRGRLLGLCLVPALLAFLDGALTLNGQSADYWAGDYSRVNEASPMMHRWLEYHPLAFVAGFTGWILVFALLILLMPQTLALTVSIAVTLGHTLGAASWLIYRPGYGHQVCCALFLLTAVGLAVGIRWGWRAEPRSDAPLGARLPFALRLGAMGLLWAIAVYLFLWPRK